MSNTPTQQHVFKGQPGYTPVKLVDRNGVRRTYWTASGGTEDPGFALDVTATYDAPTFNDYNANELWARVNYDEPDAPVSAAEVNLVENAVPVARMAWTLEDDATGLREQFGYDPENPDSPASAVAQYRASEIAVDVRSYRDGDRFVVAAQFKDSMVGKGLLFVLNPDETITGYDVDGERLSPRGDFHDALFGTIVNSHRGSSLMDFA